MAGQACSNHCRSDMRLSSKISREFTGRKQAKSDHKFYKQAKAKSSMRSREGRLLLSYRAAMWARASPRVRRPEATQARAGTPAPTQRNLLQRNNPSLQRRRCRLRPVLYVQLFQHVTDVQLHRDLGDVQRGRDFFVAKSLHHHAQHFHLPAGE